MKTKRQYLHYVPMIDQFVIFEKRRTTFWKDAFYNNARSGMTPVFFIAVGDWGFPRNSDATDAKIHYILKTYHDEIVENLETEIRDLRAIIQRVDKQCAVDEKVEAQLRAELETLKEKFSDEPTRSYLEAKVFEQKQHAERLESELETARRVREKLTVQRNAYIFRPSVRKEFGDKQIMELIAMKDAEIAAIEDGTK